MQLTWYEKLKILQWKKEKTVADSKNMFFIVLQHVHSMNSLSFTMTAILNKTQNWFSPTVHLHVSVKFREALICHYIFFFFFTVCAPVSTDRWFGHSTFKRPLNTIHVQVWNKSNCSNKLSYGHQGEKLTFIFPFLPRVQPISWEIANI